MKITKTELDDLYIINYDAFKDKRGEFVKTVHEPTFTEAGLKWSFAESFYSISVKNVIRGMHFQHAPYEHEKLVYVISGSILDVVVDLRQKSKTFGKYFSVELSAQKRNAIYIGKGFAHGFLSLDEQSIVEYHTTTIQNREAEAGIKWDSFGYDWEIKDPIVSDRDNAFDDFNNNTRYFL